MINIEQCRASYFADFVVYPLVIIAGAWVLTMHAGGPPLMLLPYAVTGFLAWSLVEYVLHRLVFHEVQPFKRWHEEHHRRPIALIGTPTAVSLILFVLLIFVPLKFSLGTWPGLATTLGLISGYLLYVIVHHGVHHWQTRPGSWMRSCQRNHARHHADNMTGWYGVITPFWDYVFFTNKHKKNKP